MAARTLFILYNADASIMGKLRYGFKKITASKEGKNGEECTPECAACDITHGGISLKETAGWIEAKKELEGKGGVKVVQLHRDELDSKVKSYIETNKVPYPVALLESEGQLQVVMDKAELGKCGGDAQAFVRELKGKGVVA